jgi:hypothetical protein
MVTKAMETQALVQEQARPRTLADYEVCQLPTHWCREPLKRPKAKIRPVERHLSVPLPAFVWEKVWEAIPVFGLEGMWVCAPRMAFYKAGRKRDPLMVGRAGAKWYFIAAWNLELESEFKDLQEEKHGS